MNRVGNIRAALVATALLASAPGARAQGTELVGELGAMLVSWGPLIVLILIVATILFYTAVIVSRRASQPQVDLLIPEMDQRNMRFEQLYAEIQGLLLRVRTGESKGYYRKIEALVRVFLVRTGTPEARKMPDEEVRTLIKSGKVAPQHKDALLAIFDRCKKGAEHESDKLDFTASELLKELYKVAKATEAEDQPRNGAKTSA